MGLEKISAKTKGVQSVKGSNIDNTDPKNPFVNETIYDAENGVSKSSNKFGLGGPLNKNTLIARQNHSYISYGFNNSGYFGVGAPKTASQVYGALELGISNSNAFLKEGFRFFTDKTQFDSNTGKGIEYKSNYHSSFTKRSLTDKEYVDNAFNSSKLTVRTENNPLYKVVNADVNHILILDGDETTGEQLIGIDLESITRIGDSVHFESTDGCSIKFVQADPSTEIRTYRNEQPRTNPKSSTTITKIGEGTYKLIGQLIEELPS